MTIGAALIPVEVSTTRSADASYAAVTPASALLMRSMTEVSVSTSRSTAIEMPSTVNEPVVTLPNCVVSASTCSSPPRSSPSAAADERSVVVWLLIAWVVCSEA